MPYGIDENTLSLIDRINPVLLHGIIVQRRTLQLALDQWKSTTLPGPRVPGIPNMARLSMKLSQMVKVVIRTLKQASPRQTFPMLPPELVAHIASFLAGDTRTLLTCSQVSYAWRAASNIQLFASVEVWNGKGREVWNGSGQELQKFIAFLRRSPNIALCVRKLRFLGRRANHNDRLSITAATLQTVIPLLPNLKELWCHDIYLSTRTLDTYVGGDEAQQSSAFSNSYKFSLERVVLQRCGFEACDTHEDLITWLSTFSFIGSLTLYWLWFDLDVCENDVGLTNEFFRLSSMTAIPHLLRVDSVDIGHEHPRVHFYLELLRLTASIGSLRRVRLDNTSQWDPLYMGRLLRDVKPGNLRELSFNIWNIHSHPPTERHTFSGPLADPRNFAERLAISSPSCARLESLAIWYPGEPAYSWSVVHEVLLSLPSTETLQTLVLAFNIARALEDTSKDWALFRDVILARFTVLKTLTVVSTGWCPDDVFEALRKELVMRLNVNGKQFFTLEVIARGA